MKYSVYSSSDLGTSISQEDIKQGDGDLFVQIDNKCFRFHVDHEGNLIFALINGQDTKITSWCSYPAIKLTGMSAIGSL